MVFLMKRDIFNQEKIKKNFSNSKIKISDFLFEDIWENDFKNKNKKKNRFNDCFKCIPI